jgi:hypothetical protein
MSAPFEATLETTEIDWSAISKGDAFAFRTTTGVVMAGTIVEYEAPDFDEVGHRFAELEEQVYWFVDNGQIVPRDPDQYDGASGLSVAEDGRVQLLTPSPVYNDRGSIRWTADPAGELAAFESGTIANPADLVPDAERSLGTEGSR